MSDAAYTVHQRSTFATIGWLKTGAHTFPCQMGRSGRTTLKREGDGATPIGSWPMLCVYYRADRVARPCTMLPIKIIRPTDGWCDDPKDRNYNRPVPLPYDASHERLWRDDHAYDLIVVLDYNISQRAMNKGSAIFMHLAHVNNRPTAGCLAFSEHDLRMILRQIKLDDRITVPG